MRIYTKHFFTSVKRKTQKNGKNTTIFGKNEAYASFTDVLRMSYECLTNVLRFFTDYSNVKIQNKNEIQMPRISKNEAYAYFTDILRLFYDSLLITQILKFKIKTEI